VTNFWKTLKPPITILAPMSDVTDCVFRQIITTTGKPDVFFTEFVSSDALFSDGRDSVKNKLQFSKNQHPIVAQIWGATPENFGRAAKRIEELGFDGIDINTGCPSRAVMKNGSGAGLIGNNELVKEIVSEIRKASPDLSLSIKTRLAEDKTSTKKWISFLLSLNIDALILHGRTTKELSRGKANWEEIGKVVKLKNKINPEIIILGNGDVNTYQEVLEKHKQYGVDGVMIGRGVFKNPWVFETKGDALTHTKEEHTDLLRRHTRLYIDTWGKTTSIGPLKKFVKIYIKNFRGSKDLRYRLMESKGYKEFNLIIKEL